MVLRPTITDAPMPPPPPAPPDPALRKKRIRRALRRAAYVGAGLLVILLIIFLLFPIWISNDQGRMYVLGQINKHMRAKVAIEDWSLGWFRGTDLKNVTITLPDGSRLLSAPRIQSDLTLWGILWGRYDIGITRIETAQLTVTRYPDRTTSLDALKNEKPGESPSLFQTLRGSLQVGSAVVTLNSAATGQSITYTDVKAGLTIASPDAPFHIQLTAIGGASFGELSLSLNATLPALADWPAPPWAMVSDVEFSAVNLPTALACDYCNLDPRWQDSIGAIIEKVRFSNHVTPPLETSIPTLEIRGTSGAFVDATLSLRASGDPRKGAGTATLSLTPPADTTRDFHLASLRISPPLVELLKQLNPVFANIKTGTGLVELRTTEMNITANNSQNMQASFRLIFPRLDLERTAIVADLLQAAGDTQTSPTVSAYPDILRIKIGSGQISYDNFTIVCGRTLRLTFGGTVGLDGTLNLLATAPTSGSGALGSARAEIPITGTLQKPVITLPR